MEAADFEANHLVVVLPAQQQALAALDIRSGAIRWRVALKFIPCAYAVSSRVIVVSGANGEVSGVSLEGELLWHNELDGMGLGVPLLMIPKPGARGQR